MKQKFNTFIRNNTEYIREGLRKLGIPQNDFDDGDRPWIAVNYKMWISVDEGYDRLFPDEIDCGDDEELFFALVSRISDTDKKQRFVCDKVKKSDGGGMDWDLGLENVRIKNFRL